MDELQKENPELESMKADQVLLMEKYQAALDEINELKLIIKTIGSYLRAAESLIK